MRTDLKQLAESIQAVEERGSCISVGGEDDRRSHLRTGWIPIDEELGGGLARGAIHEWFSAAWGHGNSTARKPHVGGQRGRWLPPLTIMLHLGRCAMAQANEANQLVVWIGRRCWPHAAALRNVETSKRQNVKTNETRSVFHFDVSTFRLFDVCLFIDPPDDAARLWAIDLALRSPAVAAVIADGSNLDMAHTRRLQLAAESPGSGAIGLFARPMWELDELSAARTRWHVSSSLDFSTFRFFDVSSRWRIELLRCKGMRPAAGRAIVARDQHDQSGSSLRSDPACAHHRAWTVEVSRAESGIHLSADMADRSDPAAAA